jgi:hypothetical protein
MSSQPKGSLLCSHEPSTSPYPEPDQSSPYHTILSLICSISTSYTHPCLDLPSGFFPYGFPQKFYTHSSSHPHVCTSPFIGLIALIILDIEYKLRNSSLCSFLQPVTSSLFGPNILSTLCCFHDVGGNIPKGKILIST